MYECLDEIKKKKHFFIGLFWLLFLNGKIFGYFIYLKCMEVFCLFCFVFEIFCVVLKKVMGII